MLNGVIRCSEYAVTTDLLHSFADSVKVQPGNHVGASDHGRERSLVLLLVGEGKRAHCPPMKAGGERDELVRRRC